MWPPFPFLTVNILDNSSHFPPPIPSFPFSSGSLYRSQKELVTPPQTKHSEGTGCASNQATCFEAAFPPRWAPRREGGVWLSFAVLVHTQCWHKWRRTATLYNPGLSSPRRLFPCRVSQRPGSQVLVDSLMISPEESRVGWQPREHAQRQRHTSLVKSTNGLRQAGRNEKANMTTAFPPIWRKEIF